MNAWPGDRATLESDSSASIGEQTDGQCKANDEASGFGHQDQAKHVGIWRQIFVDAGPIDSLIQARVAPGVQDQDSDLAGFATAPIVAFSVGILADASSGSTVRIVFPDGDLYCRQSTAAAGTPA